MNTEIESWIEEAFEDQSRPLRKLSEEEGDRVVSSLMKEFVVGNPRVWWLALRHPHTASDSVDQSILSVMPQSRDILWFIPETDERKLPVFEVSPADIDYIRSNCPPFEYYVADKSGAWLIIESDHDEFIVTCRPQ